MQVIEKSSQSGLNGKELNKEYIDKVVSSHGVIRALAHFSETVCSPQLCVWTLSLGNCINQKPAHSPGSAQLFFTFEAYAVNPVRSHVSNLNQIGTTLFHLLRLIVYMAVSSLAWKGK